MTAKHIMTTSLVTVEPATTVQDITRRLLERHINAVPVVDQEGQIVGIVS